MKKLLEKNKLAQSPSFVLNVDQDLSLYYAEEDFYNIFETDSETFAELYQNQFRTALSYHHQGFLLEKLQKQGEYCEDVEIITSSGNLKQFCLKVQQIKLEGEKFLCSLLQIPDKHTNLLPVMV